ncbi:MAG: hypothetical protein ACOYK0_00690 [Candidatus Nanopelagicaceae bacterium]
MKRAISTSVVVAFLGTLLIPAISTAETTMTRDEAVAAYHARFDQQFNEIHARLLDAKERATSGKIKSIVLATDIALKDFDDEIAIISNTLNDPNAAVDAAVGYAIEEIGEIQWNVSTIETSFTKITTIRCVKNKRTKLIQEVLPKCPTGYKIKK